MATYNTQIVAETYSYELKFTIPTLTPSNCNTIYQTSYTPTVKRTSNATYSQNHNFASVTRYFRIKIGTKIIGTYKVVFAAKTATAISGQSGTVTKTMSSPPSLGDCMKYCALKTSFDDIMVSVNWGSTTSYSTTTDVMPPVVFSGWTPNISISNSYTSTISSQFGNVKGFCSSTYVATNNSSWTYTTGVESTKVINMTLNVLQVTGTAANTYEIQNVLVGNSVSINSVTLTEINNNISAWGVNQAVSTPVTKNTSFTIQDYIPPEINISASRKNNDVNHGTISVDYNLHSLNKTSNNQAEITAGDINIYYEIYDNSNNNLVESGTKNIVTSGTFFAGALIDNTQISINESLDATKSYLCKAWIVDRLGTSSLTKEAIIPTEFRTIDFLHGGHGVAIGEVATEEEFKIGMLMETNQDIVLDLLPEQLIDNQLQDLVYPHQFKVQTDIHGKWEDAGGYSSDTYRAFNFASSGSYNVANAWDTAKIIFSGYETFSIQIRSYAESTYDYILVSTLDNDYLANCTTTQNMRNVYNDSRYTKATTRGNQSAGAYTTVTFDNPDLKEHYFYIIYQKDDNTSSNDDKGYFMISE